MRPANYLNFTPSPEERHWRRQRASMLGIHDEIINKGTYDFIVVGAGPGGVPSAIAAARRGLSVALISGRPHIGGNASEEGTIGLDGAGAMNHGYHETGIPNEIKCTRQKMKTSWQKTMEYLVGREKKHHPF